MASKRIQQLLKEMTLKEKIGQMIQIHPNTYIKTIDSDLFIDTLTGPDCKINFKKEDIYNIGSMLSINDAKNIREIQKDYIEHHRLHIPLLFMFDIIHGYKTIFPINLGLSSSWDLSLVEKTSRVASIEGSAAGQHVTFAPMCDLVKDPRWGRVMESSGEASFLNEQMASATVRGFQQTSFEIPYSMATCTKHFAAYGAVEGGRDYNTVDISERWLREYYLSAYKASIDSGSKMVMTSFNLYDGVPATVNQFLMKKILRDEWSFGGVLISDWNAPSEVLTHSVCEDSRDCCQQTIDAGLDIEMTSMIYYDQLEKLVQDGSVSETLIDEAVVRILSLKESLGLFDNPYRYCSEELEKKLYLCDEHLEVAREAVIKSSVLLKNEDILPFSKDVKSIAIIGPHCDNNEILGWWEGCGDPKDTISLASGIREKLGQNTLVKTHIGCDIDGAIDEIDAAYDVASTCDIVILALGEHYSMSGEAGNRTSIDISGHQQALAERLLSLNKPTAMVLFTGRPLDISWFDHNVPAILNVWFPGTEGGNGIADLLFGDSNPSGKITMTFPRHVGQIPVYHNHFNTGRPSPRQDYVYDQPFKTPNRSYSNYLDLPNTPLYPFGYGLSYTTYKYSDLKLSNNTMTSETSIEVSITISNTGDCPGDEIVQLYIRDVAGSVVRPLKELKGFKKIYLESHGSKKVTFKITEKMLRFHTRDMSFKSEIGSFHVLVGPNSDDLQKEVFTLAK